MPPNRNPVVDFLTTQSAQIPINEFVLNLVLTALLAFMLGQIYVKFGGTLSSRDLFARNFVLLAMTTMMIISIVKSSLALSLGLVGALSIIRFRAAIKEPEELSFLFLAISLGLGFGAGQTVLTILAFGVITVVIALKHLVRSRGQKPNFFLTISSRADGKVTLPRITEVLAAHASGSLLTRLDESSELLEASFRVQFDSLARLNACNQQLRGLGDAIHVSYLEERGLGT